MYQLSARASWFLALLVLMKFKLVLSSVYPTEPVAATIYPTGQLATVKWRDDGHRPHLKNIGLMRIDLHNNVYESNNTRVATLAKNVDPVMQSYTLFIPPDLPTNYFYHMRFITSHPSLTIYTADFKLTTGAFHPVSLKPEDEKPQVVDTTPTPISNPILPSQLVPVTTVRANPLGGGADSSNSGAHTTGNVPKKSSGKKMDCRGHFFGLTSVLWPVVVGFSLAA